MINARYEEYSRTIRQVPQNYCLIALNYESPVFDTDAATADYRYVVIDAYHRWTDLNTNDYDLLAEMVGKAIQLAHIQLGINKLRQGYQAYTNALAILNQLNPKNSMWPYSKHPFGIPNMDETVDEWLLVTQAELDKLVKQ